MLWQKIVGLPYLLNFAQQISLKKYLTTQPSFNFI